MKVTEYEFDAFPSLPTLGGWQRWKNQKGLMLYAFKQIFSLFCTFSKYSLIVLCYRPLNVGTIKRRLVYACAIIFEFWEISFQNLKPLSDIGFTSYDVSKKFFKVKIIKKQLFYKGWWKTLNCILVSSCHMPPVDWFYFMCLQSIILEGPTYISGKNGVSCLE